jgi:phosphonatase-like hydrolase
MIELVVFDMAGTTLYDGDAVGACFCIALAAAGVEVDAARVNAVMGLHKPEAIRILLTGAGRNGTDEEVRAVHDDFARQMRTYYATDPAVCEIPGATEAFATLRREGIKVALNTGFSRAVADAALARLGWLVPAVIDATMTSDEVAHGRPHPDMILALMERLGIRGPGRVAKVGDTVVDLEEGARAGCGLLIGVTSGTSTRAQMEASPHTHIIASVADVPGIILAHVDQNRGGSMRGMRTV